MVRELRMMLELRHAVKAPAMDHDAHHRMVLAKAEGRHVEEAAPPREWEPPILKVVAAKDQGVDELVEALAGALESLEPEEAHVILDVRQPAADLAEQAVAALNARTAKAITTPAGQ